ncbi:MAG: TolC family protein [Rhizobiaceae bacterium]
MLELFPKYVCRSKWSAVSLLSLVLVAPAIVGQAHAKSMKSAVVAAVKTHPTALAERAAQRAIANELEESRQKFLPEIELFGDIGAENIHNPNSLSGSDNGSWKATRQVGVVARYTLFDGFERANAVYRNAARLDGALYSILATADTIALDAVEAYIDVYRHRQLLNIAGQNIVRHRDILSQIRGRVEGGKSSVSERIQIEERVFAAQSVEIEIEKASQDAAAKYRRVIGASPGGSMSIPGVKSLPRSINALVDSSLAGNPNLKALEKAVSESEYTRYSSESALRPKLFLEGKGTIGADRGGSRGDQREAFVGLKLSWKLFDGNASTSREMALAERVSNAMYVRDAKAREIQEIAEQSWNSYVNSRKRNSILRSQVASNRKIVKNYRDEYELSKRSLLDVLDAERARFNSEFQQIGAVSAQQFAKFRMLAVQGKLAANFGISRDALAASPDFEDRFLNSTSGFGAGSGGQGIFNIDLAPLK